MWFRLYTIVTILIALTVGVVAFWLAALDQPTVWFGLIERINVYGYLLLDSYVGYRPLARGSEGSFN
jgi:hypothetical protein